MFFLIFRCMTKLPVFCCTYLELAGKLHYLLQHINIHGSIVAKGNTKGVLVLNIIYFRMFLLKILFNSGVGVEWIGHLALLKRIAGSNHNGSRVLEGVGSVATFHHCTKMRIKPCLPFCLFNVFLQEIFLLITVDGVVPCGGR